MNNAFAGSWVSLPIPLTEWLLDIVHSMGFTQMTPVQASTIPLFMKHKDVVVEAVTGSGKTLAFVIPVLERLIRRETRLKRNEIGALVISPTRELASQIHTQFALFLQSQPNGETEQPYPEPLLLVSSEHSSPAQDAQRFLSTGADIVIGTPGRIEEFLLREGRSSVSVKELEVLVMDEADRLLDLGFQPTLTKIITHLPKQRRTGLFSATMTDADALSELVRVGLRNPARIVVKVQTKKVAKRIPGKDTPKSQIIEERRTPANLQIYYINCRFSEKLVQLVRIIEFEMRQKNSSYFILYFATCACVDYFYKILPTLTKFKAMFYSLHGNLPPSARTRTLDAFASSIASSSNPSILLATDVAARGLDLPQVDTVVQFDSPTDTKTFSHRCGRTARAGRAGTAWVLLSGREIEFCDFLAFRKIPVKEWPYLYDEAVADARPEDSDVELYLREIRAKLSTDRALHDQSVKAFVSFIRAYSKHEASYIFRVKDLDMIGIAKCYGLLRLPSMPELKNLCREGWEDDAISWDSYSYADTAREAKRSAVAENKSKASPISKQADKNAAWSSQKERKEGKHKRLEKKVMKKKWLASKNSESTGEGLSKKRGFNEVGHGEDADDWEDLACEEKLAKRVRKGKVSQQEFDAEFGVT